MTSSSRTDGAQIRKLRIESGKKPGEFAAAVGISYVHLYNVETGSKQASPEVLHRIARELQVPADELLLAVPA